MRARLRRAPLIRLFEPPSRRAVRGTALPPRSHKGRREFLPQGARSLAVDGPFASALAGEEDNLVMRATRALAERYGIVKGASLVLDKRLPVASGIGGGSADALLNLQPRNAGMFAPPDQHRTGAGCVDGLPRGSDAVHGKAQIIQNFTRPILDRDGGNA